MAAPDRVTLGPTSVSRIGFGAMQLPGPGAFGPPRDRQAAVEVLRRALELGVDHIDTAQYYGPDVANELIREVLHPYPPTLALVSKVGAVRDERGRWLPAQRPAELRAGVEDNLRSLGVERLAAVNLRRHGEAGASGAEVALDDQLAEMVALRDEGKIAAVGLSNVSLDELDRALAATEVGCVQNAYNLAERSSEAVLDRCEERGVAFVPFFPLGSAMGRTNPVLEHPGVQAAAQRLGATAAQVALAWLLERSAVIALIPGTSSVTHLEQNLAAAEVHLDDEAREALAGAAAEL